MPNEVFVSHSSKDRKQVEKLVEALTRHGIPSFYSRRSIVGAQQWHDEIGDALKRCDWFLLVLTPNAIDSKWVKYEVLHALSSDRYNGHVIPLWFRECEDTKLSWILPQYQRVDFRRFDDGCRGLLKLWGMGYRPL